MAWRESEREEKGRGRGWWGKREKGGPTSVGRAGKGMDGCKSGEISKPGWELSSSGQHHGWRVELECLPTPHAAPQFSHHNAISPHHRASEQGGRDDRRGQVIHPGSSRIGGPGAGGEG